MALRAVWALHTYFATREQMLCKFPTFSINANVFIRPLWKWSAPLSAPPPPLLQIRSENHICTAALKNQMATFSGFLLRNKNMLNKQPGFICPDGTGLWGNRLEGGNSGILTKSHKHRPVSFLCVSVLANSILLCLQKSLGREREREILRKQSAAR